MHSWSIGSRAYTSYKPAGAIGGYLPRLPAFSHVLDLPGEVSPEDSDRTVEGGNGATVGTGGN